MPALLSLAATHRLTAATVDALLAGSAATLPDATRQDLRSRQLMAAAGGLAITSVTRRALDALEGIGIGAVLAPTPAAELRLAGVPVDLSGFAILTSATRLPHAHDALIAAGYIDSSTSEHVRVTPGDRPGVHLTLLASEPGFDDRSLDAALARASDATLADGRVRVLAPADRFVALCGRAEDLEWLRLDVLVAASRLASSLDTAALTRVNPARLRRAVLTTCLLARDVLQAPSPLAPLADRDRQVRSRARAAAEALAGGLAPRAAPRPSQGPSRRRELWIAGFPSQYGGADTELDHAIDLLRSRDIAVHLVPMFGADEGTRESVLARGCTIHDFRPDIFRDHIVVSYCNGEFLKALPDIMKAGRPARVVWFNCMTWLFDGEKSAHERGWIDLFGFQSQYQRRMLEPQLEALGPVRTFPYRPYFNPERAAWRYRDWNGTYRLGRISRDDGGKFADDTWRIFDRVLVPPPLRKKAFILGYGPNAAAKIGDAPAGLDWQTWGPGGVPAKTFYRTIDTMVHKTGGSRENYPRVLIEAYAYGVVPVVERDFGFPELVVHGETGLMASDSDEMSYHASWLAHHPEVHRRLAEQGRRHLTEQLSDPDACWAGWEQVLAT